MIITIVVIIAVLLHCICLVTGEATITMPSDGNINSGLTNRQVVGLCSLPFNPW